MVVMTPFIAYQISSSRRRRREEEDYSNSSSSETKKSNPWWDEMDDRRKAAYKEKGIFTYSEDKDIKVFEKALKEFDKEKISEMIKGGFNINQCDNEGKTLTKVWEKWCYDNIGGVFKEDLERASFLYSVGARDETEESNRIKFELKQKNAEMERRKYISTLPPKGEILSIEDALKYEDIEALKSLLKKGHSINKCDEYGNTLLEQCLTKWLKLHSKQEFDDRYGYIYSSEYMHVDRVRDILEYFGAKRNTSESMQIREQRFKESIEKEKREEEARKLAIKKELNDSKLAKVRNKVAKVADKITEVTGTEKVVQKFTDGKKIADVEISEKNKVLEKKISDKLFSKVNE